MKRGFVFHLHTITIALVLAVLCSSRFGKIFTAQGPAGAMPDFNEMFKNFDFDKFVQELDEQLAHIEAEEAATGIKNPTGLPKPTSVTPYGQPTNTTTSPVTGMTTIDNPAEKISDDPVKLITEPPMITKTSNNKSMLIPHKDAETALINYVQDIINSLQKIDHSALSSHGEEFHEHYLAACGDSVTDLVVSLTMIISKRAYRVAVLAPPKELDEKLRTYRKHIITVRAKLMTLVKELSVSEADEISEEDRMRKKLEALAQVSQLQATIPEPVRTTPQPVQADDDNDKEEDNDDDADNENGDSDYKKPIKQPTHKKLSTPDDNDNEELA